MFVFGVDQVGLVDVVFVQDLLYCVVVVVDVDLVMDIGVCVVEFGLLFGEYIGDLMWNEFFDVLIWFVVVGVVGDCCVYVIGLNLGLD